jgi:transposase
MESAPVFAGVDVSKARLDVACSGIDETWSVSNAPDGIAQLVERLREIEPVLVVMEATGGFEVAAAADLTAAEIPVVIANPRQVRDFAKCLALFAERVRPPVPTAGR